MYQDKKKDDLRFLDDTKFSIPLTHLWAVNRVLFKNKKILTFDTTTAAALMLFDKEEYEHQGIASVTLPTYTYRYGFNGQEIEIAINQSVTSAEYWFYDGRLGRRWNVDPVDQVSMSNYTCFGNNPLINIDPKGDKYLNFDKSGNYINTTKDTKWHNFWHGAKGRALNDKGKSFFKFNFADPKNDVANLENGKIKGLVFVSNYNISEMMRRTPLFNKENIVQNQSYSQQLDFITTNDGKIDPGARYDPINESSKGNGAYDYSYRVIPDYYTSEYGYYISEKPLSKKIPATPYLFLVEKTAHNHMNFGNFMWGTTGQVMGYSIEELRVGAHFNSKYNSTTNGYESQWDSKDDQKSIMLGYHYMRTHKLVKLEIRISKERPFIQYIPTPMKQ